MKQYLIWGFILFTLFGCKNNNKKTFSGNQNVGAEEFFGAYNELKLPFEVSDTNMRQVPDTNKISYAIFTQFIPDTIFNSVFGKDRKLTIHPIGKVEQKGKESYFATLVNSKSNSAIYLSVYDKNKVTANMQLVVSDDDEKVTTATIDKKLSITINKEWTIKDDIYYNRMIYAYNNVGIFTIVLSETNADRKSEKIVSNPIDTFPKRFKYSGDYKKGGKNLVSLRDGKMPNEYRFFIYFESGNEEDACGGEIRGVMKMASEKVAIFKGEGDPCKLNFNFASNTVIVKETGSCGNYRGIKCFFNDTYTKKKETKTVARKK
jgi:hypothetical protein